ncbi:MAG: FxLYD domain-containing protein [Bryobacteraceae bacterium]
MGRFLAIVLVAAAAALSGMAQKKPKQGSKQTPTLAITAFEIRREGDIVAIEGAVKNVSGKPVKGVVLFFEFLEFNGRMISRMKTEVSEETLEDGEEAEFLTQTPDQVRAVHVRIDGEDKAARYLILDKPGPYPIE